MGTLKRFDFKSNEDKEDVINEQKYIGLLDAYSLLYFSIIGCDINLYPLLKNSPLERNEKLTELAGYKYSTFFSNLLEVEYWVG